MAGTQHQTDLVDSERKLPGLRFKDEEGKAQINPASHTF
jgi:hypothetical protein